MQVLLLILLVLHLVVAEDERCGGGVFITECKYGYDCLERQPGDRLQGRWRYCERPKCGGAQKWSCRGGFECLYPNTSTSVIGTNTTGECYPLRCGGDASKACPDGMVCRTNGTVSQCEPKLPSHAPGYLPLSIEGNGYCDRSQTAPRGCPDDDVCVEFVKGGLAYGVPGVCVNRVDCRKSDALECPDGWKCNMKNLTEPYCEIDFDSMPNSNGSALPPRPEGKTCYFRVRGGPEVPCPKGQVCLEAFRGSLYDDGPGVCIPEVLCGKMLGHLAGTCGPNPGWKCSNETGIGLCMWDFK